MNKIIKVNKLSKSYNGKDFALHPSSLELEHNKILAIVGESGSGKTTLLRLIAGLEIPDSGTIQIEDRFITSDHKITKPQNRDIGFVFQDFALFPHLTVEQNITYGVKTNKNEVCDKLLSLLKMDELKKRYPSELSGGQQQRVAIARSLATEPKLLLLDEPFSNLDTNLKSNLRKELKKVVTNINTSMIFITHDLHDAIDIADEIIFIKKGTILQQLEVKNLSCDTNHSEVKKIVTELKDNANLILNLIN